MSIITNIKRKFSRLFSKPHDIFKDSRYTIKYEAALGCYYFDDISNMPYERGLQAVTFFTELSENCTKEVMKEFHTAIGKCFQGTKIDISQLVLIHKVLGDRLYKLPPAPAIILRLASVVYFDKDEDPTTYDFKYNLTKIERWKKEFPDGSFFLQLPLKKLVPFLNESEENIKTYLKVWNEIENMTLENLLSQPLMKQNNSEANKVEA